MPLQGTGLLPRVCAPVRDDCAYMPACPNVCAHREQCERQVVQRSAE
jgi:hypothetical protein